MTRRMTWNMQGAGSSDGPSEKWQLLSDFLNWMGSDVNEVALQECGTIDKVPGAEFEENVVCNGWDVLLYKWTTPGLDPETASQPPRIMWICFVQFDYGKGPTGRVNLATVTKHRPTQVECTTASDPKDRRPALCVKMAEVDDWFVTLHANAAFGCDAEALLVGIHDALGSGTEWFAGGDFNKIPADVAWNGEQLWNLNPSIVCVSSNFPTHHRVAGPTKEIDYAARTAGAAMSSADTLDMGVSDHLAVVFS